MVKIPQNCT